MLIVMSRLSYLDPVIYNIITHAFLVTNLSLMHHLCSVHVRLSLSLASTEKKN